MKVEPKRNHHGIYPFHILALFLNFCTKIFKATDMEEGKINRQKQNHQQGSGSYGGKKSSKKKPHNSVLRCRTNSNLTRKSGKARRRKDIKTLKRKVKALVEKMEAKVAKMRREREETLEIAAVAEDMKLELDLVKISIHQHSNDMLCISYAVDQLAEILLHLN